MNVICFGDSNTYGFDPRSWLGERYEADSRWVDLLASKTGWNVRNEGENGREIPNTPVFFPDTADLLIVMLGTNDLLIGYSPEEAESKMARLLTTTRLSSDKILLICPPYMARGAWVTDDDLIDASKRLSAHFRSLAARLGVCFLDSGMWNLPLCYDGVHLTQEGHRIFADHLIKELMK